MLKGPEPFLMSILSLGFCNVVFLNGHMSGNGQNLSRTGWEPMLVGPANIFSSHESIQLSHEIHKYFSDKGKLTWDTACSGLAWASTSFD